MSNAVERFRVDLSVVVRRLSRAQSNETAIDEMVSHFEGLYQEELKSESDEASAEMVARKRMGSIYKIAFQIVNTPDRRQKGFRLQALMFIIFFIAIPLLMFTLAPLNHWVSYHQKTILYTLTGLIFASGFIAGIGISITKRPAWKSLAIITTVSFLATSTLVDYRLPEVFKPKKELTELVALQSNLEPKVAKIEAQVKNILSLKDQSPETWKKELSTLPGLVKEANVPFYKEDYKSTGTYLYPSNVAYNWREETVNYSVTLSRTADLMVAKGAWRNTGGNALFPSDFHNRENTFQFWREAAANQSTLWTRGFIYSAEMFFRLTLIYCLLIFLGLFVSRVRCIGFDWLRLSRG